MLAESIFCVLSHIQVLSHLCYFTGFIFLCGLFETFNSSGWKYSLSKDLSLLISRDNNDSYYLL